MKPKVLTYDDNEYPCDNDAHRFKHIGTFWVVTAKATKPGSRNIMDNIIIFKCSSHRDAYSVCLHAKESKKHVFICISSVYPEFYTLPPYKAKIVGGDHPWYDTHQKILDTEAKEFDIWEEG